MMVASQEASFVLLSFFPNLPVKGKCIWSLWLKIKKDFHKKTYLGYVNWVSHRNKIIKSVKNKFFHLALKRNEMRSEVFHIWWHLFVLVEKKTLSTLHLSVFSSFRFLFFSFLHLIVCLKAICLDGWLLVISFTFCSLNNFF